MALLITQFQASLFDFLLISLSKSILHSLEIKWQFLYTAKFDLGKIYVKNPLNLGFGFLLTSSLFILYVILLSIHENVKFSEVYGRPLRKLSRMRKSLIFSSR